MQKIIGDWLLLWQTLIAGVIALVGALITVRALNTQARDDRARKARAARAMLPAALASVDDYALACIRWLKDARQPAQQIDAGANIAQMRFPGPLPPPDSKSIDVLRDCVEHAEAAPAAAIADLLSVMQVQRSRLLTLQDRFTNPQHYSGRRVLLAADVDAYSANSVELHAMSNKLFAFARSKHESGHRPIDLSAVARSFRQCELDEGQDAGVWKVLTDRYSEAP